MQDKLRGEEILIIKNITREGPGIIEEILIESGIKYTVVDLSLGQDIQPLDNYGAVIVLGGPDSANDSNPKMKRELALIREVLNADIPYLGICLGFQTLVHAAGGHVVKSKIKEVGFRDPDGEYFEVELTEDGQHDPLFAGLGLSFNVFHLHGETVNLAENMQLLATGKFCQNQIVRAGSNAYGIQCHFELTPEMFETWIKDDPDLQEIDRDILRSDFEVIKNNYTRTGYQLFRNFLKIAGFL